MTRLRSPELDVRPSGTKPEPQLARIAAVLLCVAAAWFVYGTITHIGTTLHDDATEAYVWGQEFQLGYNQHPPFWAWVAGLWFLIFPNREWAFVLLAVLNAAVGLLGAWYAIGRFATGATRSAAWLLLLCTPFYTFRCYQYNANTIFLSVWPWTIYYFMRAMERPRVREALLFGLMMGIALLSKYFAITLALTLLLASWLHPNARPYWRSASPWISAAVTAVLLLPHLVWAIVNKAPPVQYALGLTGFTLRQTAASCLATVGELVALQLPIPVLIWLTRRRDAAPARNPDTSFLAVLVLFPVFLTLLFSLCFGLRIRGAMLIGTFPLAPLLVIRLFRSADPRRLLWWTSRVVAFGTALVLVAAPLIVRLLPRPRDFYWQLPLKEAADAGNQLWRRTTDKPLRIVGGSHYYSNAAAFYSDDRPSGFVFLDFARSPWITPERVHRDGLLAICDRIDGECRSAAMALGGPQTVHEPVTLTHTVFGKARGTADLDLYVIPPPAIDPGPAKK